MEPVNVLSFGAGVQSTTLALLSGSHDIPLFDFAVFADTGAEPQSVYDCLGRVRDRVSYPIITHMHKNGLLDAVVSSDEGFKAIPAFIENPDGTVGMLRRQCTREFKLSAIVSAIRAKLGYEPRQRVQHVVNVYVGISRDEMQRMANPLAPWMVNKYPLVDMRWRRAHCAEYLSKEWPQPVGKSSCTICPYHDNKSWREMKENDPDSWAQAVTVDESIRNGFKDSQSPIYLHRSMKPLTEVDFDALLARDDDQREFGFLEECDGICGM